MENKTIFTAKDRWLAYFDILGFKNLTEYVGPLGVVYLNYDKIIQKIAQAKDYNITPVWFSDTFLFYADDDSFNSFSRLEGFASGFFFDMFLEQIPMRGCINCGDFYADKPQNIYLGKGWIDAYEQGEHQQIIGFTMTKEAESKLTKCSVSNNNEHDWKLHKKYFWLEQNIPFEKKGKRSNHFLPIYNLKTGTPNECALKTNGERLRNALNSMQHIAEDLFHKTLKDKNTISNEEKTEKLAKIMEKYNNTSEFLSTAYPESNNVLKEFVL